LKPVLWLAAGSVISAALLSQWFGREVWLGMFGPLVVVSGTWVLTERVYKADPVRVTPVVMTAFAAKLIFFGAYVALAIGVLGVQPMPFAASFTGYFVVLHMIEALLMKRLFV
jgi:hypothetical protein